MKTRNLGKVLENNSRRFYNECLIDVFRFLSFTLSLIPAFFKQEEANMPVARKVKFIQHIFIPKCNLSPTLRHFPNSLSCSWPHPSPRFRSLPKNLIRPYGPNPSKFATFLPTFLIPLHGPHPSPRTPSLPTCLIPAQGTHPSHAAC